MSFWLREVAGWILIVLGLLMFSEVYSFCIDRRPIEAGILTVVAAFVFRGGIHLLKVAVAARICGRLQDRPIPPLPPRELVNRSTASMRR